MFEDDFMDKPSDEALWESSRDTITYDENWQNVSESEYPHVITPKEAPTEANREPARRKRRDNSPRQLLVVIQLIVCAAIALCAFALKQFGGEWYSVAREWYYSQLNASVIADGRTSFDLSSLFSSTPDEV